MTYLSVYNYCKSLAIVVNVWTGLKVDELLVYKYRILLLTIVWVATARKM